MSAQRKEKNKTLPLGLVHSNANSITASYAHAALPKSNVPFMRSKKRPSLEGAPELSPVAKKSAPPKPAPIALSPTLNSTVGYHNPKILDIANNFSTRTSRENVAKVYAAAATLGVQYRPVSQSKISGLFAANYSSIKPRSSVAANDAYYNPTGNVHSFHPRVGGRSVLSSIFGKSPLAGTGLRRYPSDPAPKSVGFSAPKPRLSA